MNAADTQYFFESVYGDALEQQAGNLVVWSPQNKLADFHTAIDTAVASVGDRVANKMDVYFGLGLIKEQLNAGQRGKAADVCCLTCFWCDLDIAGAAHKKKRLPPDEPAALDLLDRLQHEPSMIIRSGHGLQPYWLFSEPWTLAGKPDHDRAAAAARQWITHLQAAAQAHGGWTLDSVGDLARVFRVPGTINHKEPDVPVDVTILKRTGPVYHVDDLIEASLASAVQPPPTANQYTSDVRGARIVLSPGAEPPSAKMDALRENDKRFDETWTRKRVLASPSEYDMALANAAVACDWTDQEVINMLIAHRRKHGDDLKLRLDYYIRTVGKARESQQAAATESKAFDALDDIIRDPTPLTPPQASELPEAATGAETQEQAATDVATPAAGHPTLMAAVSKLLGFEVSRWIQRGREPRRAEYSLVLPGGREVLIGNSAAFLKPSTFRHSILDALSIVMPMYKAGKWTTICKALTLGVEIVENDELYRDIQVTDWLRQYTAGGLQYVDKNWSLALPQCDPFIVDGLLHVHVGTFHKFIRLSLYEQISKTDLYGYLGTVGFDRVQKTARIEDIENPVSRSYFAGPAGVLDDLSKPL